MDDMPVLVPEPEVVSRLQNRVGDLHHLLRLAAMYLAKAVTLQPWFTQVHPQRAIRWIEAYLDQHAIIDEPFDALLAQALAEHTGPRAVVLSTEAWEALERLWPGSSFHDYNDIASDVIVTTAQEPRPDKILEALTHIWGKHYKADKEKAAVVDECMEAIKKLLRETTPH